MSARICGGERKLRESSPQMGMRRAPIKRSLMMGHAHLTDVTSGMVRLVRGLEIDICDGRQSSTPSAAVRSPLRLFMGCIFP